MIVVDTHRPGLTECPVLLEMTERIAVLDHHRRSTDAIENPTLAYMEPYASSASELVTEILELPQARPAAQRRLGLSRQIKSLQSPTRGSLEYLMDERYEHSSFLWFIPELRWFNHVVQVTVD